MRIGRAQGRLVIIGGDGVTDVAAASGGEFSADPDQVFAVWDRFTEWAGRHAGGRTGPLVPGDLGAPVLTPAQVFGIGLNYREHAAESGVDAPAVPPVFTKFRSCLTGPYAAVELPSDRVDWEVELVAVIGRPAERVPEEKAWSYVAGLMVGQDLSERTVQLAGPVPQFSLGKSFPGFGPTGPWLVTPDELPDADDLRLSLLGRRPGAAGRPDQGHDLLRARAGGPDLRGPPDGAGRPDLHRNPVRGGHGA
jgi:2,4-diketo-3-deoxy-L-fuconate hydrolase